MKANVGRWFFAVGLLCAMPGCTAVTAPVDDGSAPTDETDQAVVFEDDLDPATASLPTIPNQLLVQPYPGADGEALDELYRGVGAVPVGHVDDIQVTVLDVPTGGLDEAAAVLATSELIETIHRNYVLHAQRTPNDSRFGLQAYMVQAGMIDAWDETTGSQQIMVAVVDTGVDVNHPDLVDKVVDGWNVYDDNDDISDHLGHGTNVAGVLAASGDNDEGIAGVTWQSPILAVRVTDEEGATTSRHVAAGVLWAASRGAKVINVSFAPLWSNSVVRAAARQAFHRGSLVVISAGNAGGTTTSRGYGEALFVGAVDAAGGAASFTDRGPFVDLVAPGIGIHTTAVDSRYASPSGTSFAAPIVSGAAALAWSVNQDLRPASILKALTSTAHDLGATRKDNTYGHGIVDAAAAVVAAGQSAEVRDRAAPSVRVTRPADRARLSSRFAVSVTATDDQAVADVVMSIDGIAFATDTRSPYRYVVDPSRFTAGRHVLGFVATDIAGNESDPDDVVVTFVDPSTSSGASDTSITFHTPSSGSIVTGDTTIQATATASAGLATFEWFVDGESAFAGALSGDSSGVSYLWRTAGVSDGTHTITLAIIDAAGRTSQADLALTTR